MTALERALEAIDAGVQRSGEPAMGTGSGCLHCHRIMAAPADWCPDCRAYLLGDSDVDPALGPTVAFDEVRRSIVAGPGVAAGQSMVEGFEQLGRAQREAWAALASAFVSAVRPILDALEPVVAMLAPEVERRERELEHLRHGHQATCPRHGRTRGGICRRCAR